MPLVEPVICHSNHTDKAIRTKIRKGEISWAGNKNLKIYGKLRCRSGKRMKRENRVFFFSEAEALALGFRPCAHCQKAKYLEWKSG